MIMHEHKGSWLRRLMKSVGDETFESRFQRFPRAPL